MRSVAGARIVLAAVMLLLLWRVLHVNAVVFESANRPVLRIPAEGPARGEALRAAVAANPSEVGALLELGLERERAGDLPAAARAYAAALEIAPIDRGALRVAAALDAREGRLADAVRRLDRLLAYYPGTRDWAFPLLAQWLALPEPRSALEALAAGPTAWMGAFIGFTCARDVDPVLAATLLVRRAAAGRAQPAEVGCVTERLRSAGRWADAYQVWLNTLPRERLADVGFVFNGGFEFAPSGVGFDWIADDRAAGFRVDYPTAGGAEGRRALRVTWSGKRASQPAVRQSLALDPGRYEMSGMARLEGLQSVRGIQWSLRCAGEPRSAPLGASPRFVGSGEWQRFAFGVEVPARCAGQVLQLEPSGLYEGTTYVTGKAWFDGLRLARSN
jgi:hypothetical protein